jgi:hypothetical protein
MLPGFIIWTVICAVIVGIGIYALCSKEPVGFWAGVKPKGVKDVKKYNRAVGILWLVYAGLLELLGVPLLFLKQNSAGFVPVILGTVAITIGLAVAYTMIEKKYRT